MLLLPLDRLDPELSAGYRRQLPSLCVQQAILPLESFRLLLLSVKSWPNFCALLPTFRDTTVLVGDVSARLSLSTLRPEKTPCSD